MKHIGSTVRMVSLRHCGIKQITDGDLQPLQVMTNLNVEGNLLEEVPDFRSSPAKTSMQQLYLSDNRIVRINLDRLSGMLLNYIKIISNELETMPNWCRVNKLPLFVDILGNGLTCDRRLRWTMRAMSAGLQLVSPELLSPCVTPAFLADHLWGEILESDLGDTGNLNAVLYSNWYCQWPISGKS